MIDKISIELQILDNENLQSQGDRYNLAISSDWLYANVLRVLYSEVSFGNRHGYKMTQASGFLNTILRRPELASAVHSVTLRGWETRFNHYSDPSFATPNKSVFKYDADIIRHLLLESMYMVIANIRTRQHPLVT